jgi:hypothetical protein
MTALFGPQSYSNIGGLAKIAQPATFCEVPFGYSAVNNILLIERGNCTFYQKAQNALRAGAGGVVIADVQIDSSPDFPLRMGYPMTENPSLITIPVVSTSGSDFISLEKLVFSSNGTVIIYLEQAGFNGDHGGTGNSPIPSEPGPDPRPMPTNPDGDHDGRSPHGGRSIVMNGMIISAIVVSSCLCGFCLGRRCSHGRRYCRRQQQQQQQQQQQSEVSVAPLPLESTVHGGERYVQVDMNQAPPVAYYGEQEMAPVPSAPPQDSAYPSSAPSHYA